MRLIFLDIDGVLNHGYDTTRGGPDGFDYCVASCVDALNTILQATDAKIVVSSSWRIVHSLEDLRRILRDWGVQGDVVGATSVDLEDEDGYPAARIAEIRAYLDAHPCTSFLVVDDQDVRLDINNAIVSDAEIEARLLRTYTRVGLTADLVPWAIALLRGGLHA